MPKRQLIRLVYDQQSGIQIDPSGKLVGRGSYLCTSKHCWEKAITTNVMALTLKVPLSVEDYQRLGHYFETSLATTTELNT
jgi:hypothetical protein